MSMKLRNVAVFVFLTSLSAILLGCSGDDTAPPDVRVLSPDDGVSLAGKRVTFRAELKMDRSQTAESWTLQWSFGDGETATGPEVTHTYDEPGAYRVSVVAVDADREAGEPTELSISVRNAPPTAQIQAEPAQGSAPLGVTFNAEGSGDTDGSITAMEWDLGDGTTQTGRQVTHRYSDAGRYDVTLTVRDSDGAEASASTTVLVSRRRSDRPPVTWEVRMVTASDSRSFFEPSVLVVEPGDTVRWTVGAGRHSSTSYDAALPDGAESWDTGVLAEAGEHVDVTFPEKAPDGSYPYYCRVHEDAGMLGLIVVGEPSELDPGFRDELPGLLRTKLDELIQHAKERTKGESP